MHGDATAFRGATRRRGISSLLLLRQISYSFPCPSISLQAQYICNHQVSEGLFHVCKFDAFEANLIIPIPAGESFHCTEPLDTMISFHHVCSLERGLKIRQGTIFNIKRVFSDTSSFLRVKDLNSSRHSKYKFLHPHLVENSSPSFKAGYIWTSV
jgi:hypothetical protein